MFVSSGRSAGQLFRPAACDDGSKPCRVSNSPVDSHTDCDPSPNKSICYRHSNQAARDTDRYTGDDAPGDTPPAFRVDAV